MKLKDKLEKIIEDLATLEVATLTQPVIAEIDLSTEKEIFEAIRKNINQSKLVAYSKFELDGDSVNFINNESSNANLVEGHKELVIAAQQARKAMFDTAVGAVKSGIDLVFNNPGDGS